MFREVIYRGRGGEGRHPYVESGKIILISNRFEVTHDLVVEGKEEWSERIIVGGVTFGSG
jgi:hypothetical protein